MSCTYSSASVLSSPDTPPGLDKKRHTRYWLRCLRTHLPSAYIPNDSNRMTLAFFTISALDLLSSLVPNTTPEERAAYIDWIYSCQIPSGGFRASPSHDLSAVKDGSAQWDPANVPATYFALATLLILGDDLNRVRRKETLKWLRCMQRDDGSFGETLVNGKIEGGMDTRFGYCATCVRYILRGKREGPDPTSEEQDTDVDALVECLRKAETYDGGMSEMPFHEAHAGFTYCAIAALHFIDRFPWPIRSQPSEGQRAFNKMPLRKEGIVSTTSSEQQGGIKTRGLTSPDLTIHWLASRLTATISSEDEEDTYADETDTPETCHDAHSFVHTANFPTSMGETSEKSRPTSHFALDWVGFNGRCNKVADTCYAFWVGAGLTLMNASRVIHPTPVRRYLLEQTAHIVGGFGKLPGDPPDVYHSYLGLAALSLLETAAQAAHESPREGRDKPVEERELKALDACMCVSIEAKSRLYAIWQRWGVHDGKDWDGGG
ncbi:geranylgeranyl transferase type-1 subunit beta [Elasticomyces elasticus]|nr:geranylgeranyl transferase type-1 subunit beta [Elasticomyces elasticus]